MGEMAWSQAGPEPRGRSGLLQAVAHQGHHRLGPVLFEPPAHDDRAQALPRNLQAQQNQGLLLLGARRWAKLSAAQVAQKGMALVARLLQQALKVHHDRKLQPRETIAPLQAKSLTGLGQALLKVLPGGSDRRRAHRTPAPATCRGRPGRPGRSSRRWFQKSRLASHTARGSRPDRNEAALRHRAGSRRRAAQGRVYHQDLHLFSRKGAVGTQSPCQ